MKANMLKRDIRGKLYVDMTEDSLLEEDDAELLALEYKHRRGLEHVGYMILNPRSWHLTDVLDDDEDPGSTPF